jgi:hypothetical protein
LDPLWLPWFQMFAQSFSLLIEGKSKMASRSLKVLIDIQLESWIFVDYIESILFSLKSNIWDETSFFWKHPKSIIENNILLIWFHLIHFNRWYIDFSKLCHQIVRKHFLSNFQQNFNWVFKVARRSWKESMITT